MHSVLFVVAKPSDPAQLQKHWPNFLGEAANALANIEETETLSEGVWLIPLRSGLPAFAELVHSAASYRFPYKVLFFSEPPEWLHSSSNS